MKTLVVWQKETKIAYKKFSSILNYEYADQIGKEKGYGKTILIGFSLPFKNRILKATQDFLAGVRYGYPICCIVAFSIDTILDRPAAQLRWSDKTDHVECCLHARSHIKKAIPLDLY